MLILQTMPWGPQHGHGIVPALRSQSVELLQVDTGSLYPALHRLQRQGWILSEWKQTKSHPRPRIYRATAAGKKQMAAGHAPWQKLVQAIDAVIGARQEEGTA